MKPYGRWLAAQWDRTAGWAAVAIGAVLVTLGAVSVSDAQNVLDQLSYLASSVAVGLFLLGVGAVLILTADSRDEWRKLDEISAALGAKSSTTDTNGAAGEITLPAEAATQDGNSRQPMAFHSMVLPGLVLAGAGTLAGAGGVRGAGTEPSALRWMQLTVLSVLLSLLAVTASHLRARRALGRRFTGLAGTLAVAVPATTAPVSLSDPGGAMVYVVAGSSLYHRVGCDLLRYSAAAPITPAAAAQDGRGPCQVCR